MTTPGQDPLDIVQHHWAQGEPDTALEEAGRLLAQARRERDRELELGAHFALGRAQRSLGRFAPALDHAMTMLRLLEGPHDREFFGRAVLPYPDACGLGAQCRVELGDAQGALDLVRRGERVTVVANHRATTMTLAAAHGYVLAVTSRPRETITLLEPAVTARHDPELGGPSMLALGPLALAYSAVGRAAHAIPLVREAIAAQERSGLHLDRSWLVGTLAEVLLHAGRLDDAETAGKEALELAERHGERGWEGLVRRVLGRIALERGDRDAALQHFDDAQEIAEQLGMMPLVERCRAELRALS
jgi:tetratricopeptide (TPR) repeat protein